jgi:Tol biopolymer transport system component
VSKLTRFRRGLRLVTRRASATTTARGVLAIGVVGLSVAAIFAGLARAQPPDARYTGRIAFLRLPAADAGRIFDPALFVVNAYGTGLRRVTPPGTHVLTYAWSPNGKLLAYIDRDLSLWLVRPDGTGRRSLLPSAQQSSVAMSWSPDGKDIAISSPGAGANVRTANCGDLALYVVPVGFGKPARVSPPRRGIGCGVSWSPLGGEIAYGDGGEVLGVISRHGGRPRLLLTSGVGAPQWSPDGKKLAAPTVKHLPNLHADRYHEISVVGADGSGRHVLTDHAYTEYPFAWSPDSRRILYGKQDREGIYVIGADGRGDHRVTSDSPPQAGWPALGWSPNGRSIVYATDRTGAGDIYLVGADGRHPVQLTDTPDADLAPSWAG